MGAKAKRTDGTLRKKTWGVRFAPDECSQLREKAYYAHTSVSEFIRRAALGRKVVEPPPPPAVNIQTYRELAKINNNLSRLVTTVDRAVNMGQGATVDVDNLDKLVIDLTAKIKEMQLQLMTVSIAGGEDDDREADN